MNTEREYYGDETRPGEMLVLDGGEYMQVESAQEQVSVAWSAAAPVGTLIARVVAVAGPPPSSNHGEVLVDSSDDAYEVGEGSSAEVVAYLERSDANVGYASVDFGDFTLVWRRPFRKLTISQSELAELGMVGQKLDKAMVTKLVFDTATPEIAVRAADFIAHLETVRLAP